MNTRLISLLALSTLLSHAASAEKSTPRSPEVDELIKRHIATFQKPSNVWISHVWFAPGTHHLEAIEALARIGAPAVDPLIRQLDDPDNEVRYLAIRALEEIGDRRAVPPLLRILGSDAYWGVRQRAALALQELRDPRAVDALLAAASPDKRDGPDFFAIYALREFPSPRVVRALSRLLALDAPEYSMRRDLGEAAAGSLGQMGFIAQKALLDASHSADPVVKRHAAWGLGLLRRDIAVDRLLELLKDPDRRVRMESVSALTWWRERRAATYVAHLLEDSDPEVRFRAALGLGYLGESYGDTLEPQVGSALIRSFKDESLRVAIEAIKSVGRMRSRTAVLPLSTLLAGGTLSAANPRDAHALARREAAEALGRISDPRALDLLLDTTRDETSYVRAAAYAALASFKGDRVEEALLLGVSDPDGGVRGAVIASLGAVGSARHVPYFARALEDPSRDVQAVAATALGAWGGVDNIPALREMARRNDRSYPIYSKAHQAIRQIRQRVQDAPKQRSGD